MSDAFTGFPPGVMRGICRVLVKGSAVRGPDEKGRPPHMGRSPQRAAPTGDYLRRRSWRRDHHLCGSREYWRSLACFLYHADLGNVRTALQVASEMAICEATRIPCLKGSREPYQPAPAYAAR